MRFTIIRILVFICLSYPTIGIAQVTNGKFDGFFEKVIERTKEMPNKFFESTYIFKCYDCDEPHESKFNVYLSRKEHDTVFGSHFFSQNIPEEGTPIYQHYYEGNEFYLIDRAQQKVIVFNAEDGKRGPIKGTNAGNAIELSFLFDFELLKEFLKSESNAKYFDTIIATTSYVVYEITFEDNEDSLSMTAQLFFNKKTFQFEKLSEISKWKDQTQTRSYVINKLRPLLDDELALDKHYKTAKGNFKEEKFLPPKRDSLALGTIMPSFEGTIFSEKSTTQFSTSIFNKITILDFWYTSCMPCIKSIPSLNKVYNKYKDHIAQYGVNMIKSDIENPDKIHQFLNRTPMDYPIVLAQYEDMKDFKVASFPTLYIFNKSGALVYVKYGLHEDVDLYEEVDKVLAELIK